MVENISKIKYHIKRKKVVLISILFLLLILSLWGIKATYAYYNSKSVFSFLGTTIGDFDIGDGDINLILYMEDDDGEYNLIKSIPLFGYYLNSEKTDCTYEDTKITYNGTANEISVESAEQTTCRVYFDQLGEADVRTYILLESDDGDYTYNEKTYIEVNQVPEFGYEYVTYHCLNENAVTKIDYNVTTREFSYSSTEKNICYAYFDAISNPDLTLYIYVQETDGSETYRNVTVIPSLNTYKINNEKSYCNDLVDNPLDAEIRYANGNITVVAENAGVCNVYLDISN